MDDIRKPLEEQFPKEAYSDVSYGSRSFITIDAYFIIERLTNIFGLCGKGWGLENLEFKDFEQTTTNKSTGEVKKEIVFTECIGKFFYTIADNKYYIPAVGEGKVLAGNIPEAHKKAETNLISKACSFLGVGLDVYKGLDPRKQLKEEQKPKIESNKPTAKTYSIDDIVYDNFRHWANAIIKKTRETKKLTQQQVIELSKKLFNKVSTALNEDEVIALVKNMMEDKSGSK